MQQNNWFDNVIWGLLLLFLIPSSIVVASWNSLPGARLYKAKIFMEDMLLAVTPTTESKATLHVAFTERRFSEAQKLLVNQSSTEGLVYLNDQVKQAKENIERASDPVAKKQMARTYVRTLKNVNTQLEQQKQALASVNPNPPQPTIIIHERVVVQQQQVVVNNYIQQVVTATPVPTSPPVVTQAPAVEQDQTSSQDSQNVQVISDYQNQLGSDITDLEQIAGDEASSESNSGPGNNGQGNGSSGQGNSH